MTYVLGRIICYNKNCVNIDLLLDVNNNHVKIYGIKIGFYFKYSSKKYIWYFYGSYRNDSCPEQHCALL